MSKKIKNLPWTDYLAVIRKFNPKAADYLITATDKDGTIEAYYTNDLLDFVDFEYIRVDGLIIFDDHPILTHQEWRDLTNQVIAYFNSPEVRGN